MKIGMLWFDNSQDPLDEKIRRAAAHYRQKFGAEPNLCFVHPVDGITQLEGIQVRNSNNVLRNHIWLGVEDGEQEAA